MQLQRQNGNIVTLARELGVGGEGTIYTILREISLAAKVYHPGKLTQEQGRKLQIMHANPPDDPMAAKGHSSIAWPVDLLQPTGGGQTVGFLMPYVSQGLPIFDFYNPLTRRQKCPLFNYSYLLRTARNLAIAFAALHDRGYVIGDVNESNILVTDSALITLVDTDSFQVTDRQQDKVYRCPVGKPEFTPPELQGEMFRDIDRAPEHDRFGLGVLIFQLLMEGIHPFAGKYIGKGEPPLLGERIKAGYFPYGNRHVPLTPMPVAPPFKMLSPKIQQLFIKCFEEGHKNLQARPDAHTWIAALEAAERRLVTCKVNSQHLHDRHLSSCPWCERRSKLSNRDPFPSRLAVQKGQHLQPYMPPRATLRPSSMLLPIDTGIPKSADPVILRQSSAYFLSNIATVGIKARALIREVILATATISLTSAAIVYGYSIYNRPRPFIEAVRIAEQTAEAGQQAKTVDDWVKLASQWRGASDLMANVSPKYHRYTIAQDRVIYYRQQSEIALQQARYLKLKELLASGLWREADQLTWEIVIKSVGQEVRDHLKRDDIEKIPCHTLQIVDDMWVDYSDGHFGFSVQKALWQQAGGLDGKFGELVGWRRTLPYQDSFLFDNEWLYYNELQFDLSAPRGHLPADVTMCGGRGLYSANCGARATWTWRGKFLNQVANCKL